MLNYVRQFIKIRVVFHTLYIWNENGDPHYFFILFFIFCISGISTCNSLSDCSKNFKNIYRVEIYRHDKPLGMLEEHEEFVNHSPAVLDLRILLMFYQQPAWFISLYIITQVILAFWLVLANDFLEDRCTIDFILT